MLTAKTSDGEMITPGEKAFKKLSLHQLKEKKKFICPICACNVILKVGTKKIPHFAHEKGSSCIDNFDSETEYHMLGKLQLYDWLKQKGFAPVIEPYFDKIKQRADISFTYNERTYCIEFQCSSIPEDVFIKRTLGYLKNSLYPIWILAGKKINRINANRVNISSFQYLFLQRNLSNQWYIPAYCPTTNQIITLSNIYPSSNRKANVQISIKSLKKVNPKELLNPTIFLKCVYNDWLSSVQQFRTTLITNRGSFKNPFLLELYSLSLSPQLLPPYIGFPLPNQLILETPPFIWQTYFLIDNLLRAKEGTKITFQAVYLSFIKRINKGDIKERSIPQVKERLLPVLVKDYLFLLSKLNVIRQLETNTFIVETPIIFPTNVIDALREEEGFYKKCAIGMDKINND